MAEAFAVIGFVSSILQLLDFGTKVIKQLHESLHCIDEIPGSLRDITLELPLLIEVLQQITHHFDHGYYRPQVEPMLCSIINACRVEIASLELILNKSLPEQQDSKRSRCLKAVYSLSHEKEIIKISSRLSGYVANLVLFQSLLAPDYIIHTIRENLDTITKDEPHQQTSLEVITQVKRDRAIALSSSLNTAINRARKGRMSNYYHRNRRFSTCVSFAQLGLLWRLQTSINISWGSGIYSIAPELNIERLVWCTSPGFEVLWSCEQGYKRWSTAEKELEQLFRIGQASPLDIDTRGVTWIEKLLCRPSFGTGDFEERMSLLEKLFKSGAKLNRNNSILCNHKSVWPPITPEWYVDIEDIDPDPFLLKFLRQCSKSAFGVWGQTPLMDAILSGSRDEIVSCLQDRRALLETNSLGQTAVHLAVIRSTELTRLLEAGAESNASDCRGINPLEYAAAYGCVDSVIILLEAGARPTLEHRDGLLHITFLKYATELKHWDVVKKAISFLRASPNYDDKFIDNEINYLMVRHLEVLGGAEPSLNGITHLLELGADQNVILQDGNTLLHMTSSPDEVKILLQAGIIHLDHPNHESTSPLMSAVNYGNQHYKAILENGCNVNYQDRRGHSALHLAVKHWISVPYRLENKLWTLDEISDRILVIKTLLIHNSDTLIRDNCRCLCSSKGCSPSNLVARLEDQQLQGNYWSLEWLLILKEQIDAGITQQALLDIIRVKKFNKLGMTHTCCYRRIWPPSDSSMGKEETDGVLDKEKDLIEELEHFMGCVSKSLSDTVDSWIKHLCQFVISDLEQPRTSWCLGVWGGDGCSISSGLTTPPFYEPFEVKELGSIGEPRLGEKVGYHRYIHKPTDTFRVQWGGPEVEKKHCSHEVYSTWIDYFHKNWTKYNYPETVDEEWHKRRKFYIMQQAELMNVSMHIKNEKNDC
ncbi:ankyrin [Hyaloscypha variabilis F]|uniref:Ankyrin n=1 Tax=Hyaloscypha variabilis (strain UAMH 11265 / GT02V1 / F) TaxID=1149755 RepID=A0A2J6R8T9_HYAVF|nr:ankyrin [Hyaloscypha variabilis F]